MMEDLNRVSQAALSAANSDSSLDELDKISSIARATAEARKAEIDAKNATKILSNEFWKTWTSLLIPIASLLTVLATVYIQNKQLLLTRQQIEDTEWRDFLGSMRNSQNSAISDVTFVPRLKSFLPSETYGAQAVDVGKRLMGNLTDKAGFDDLYDTLFPVEKDITLHDITDILKNLQRTDAYLQTACSPVDPVLSTPPEFSSWGYCVDTITDEQALSYLKNYGGKDVVMQARKNSFATTYEEKKLSNEIASIIKRQTSKNGFDLSGLVFEYGDFSSVNFSSSDLTNSSFDNCDLSMTEVTPGKSLNTDFNTSNWWDAKAISRTILEDLIANRFPGFFKGEEIHVHKGFSQDYYLQQINRLCRVDELDCSKLLKPYKEESLHIKDDL
jgi:hypothetical protein